MSHGDRKDGRRHRRHGGGGRGAGGRARPSRHEGHRARARTAAVTWRPNARVRANPLRSLSYGNQAGGGTVHYGAVSWRFHEDDPTLTIQALAYMSADAIVNRYRKNPGPLA
jgi:hypothetical protein